MDNKKLIAGFGYQEGRISSWDGKRTYTQAAPQMAKHCCDNGADEILIYDWSVTDDDHEAAIAAGVDAKDGMVAIQGWEQVSTVTATDLCLKMKEYGVKHIIYTDISRDGMLSGPNIPATKKLTEETGLDIIASGGVSCMEDLQALYDAGISGAIMGKALYEKRVDLEEAVRRFEK